MNCPYCQSATRSEWIYCKGCHWTIPQPELSHSVTVAPAKVTVRYCAFRDTNHTINVTHPGMSAREFDDSLAAQFRRMGDAKLELGRALLPIFERVLRPLSRIAGKVSR